MSNEDFMPKTLRTYDFFHILAGAPLWGMKKVLIAIYVVSIRVPKEADTLSTLFKGTNKPEKGKKANLDPNFLKTTK